MLKIPDRFGRKDPLKPDEIEAIIQHFEQAAAEDELPGGTFGGKGCQICYHAAREEINRGLLINVTYTRLSEKFKIEMTAFHRHYYRHLIPFMRLQLGRTLLDLTTRIEATRKFPIKSSQRKQYEWCLEQLDVIRRIQVDEIDTPGKTKFKRGTLNEYFKMIIHIRDTIGLTHGKPKQAPEGGEGEKPKSVGDYLTPEQKAEIAKAKRIREGGGEEEEGSSGAIPEPSESDLSGNGDSKGDKGKGEK